MSKCSAKDGPHMRAEQMSPDPNMQQILEAEQMLANLRNDAISAHRTLWRKLFVAESVSQVELDSVDAELADAIECLDNALAKVRIILKRERSRDCYRDDRNGENPVFSR